MPLENRSGGGGVKLVMLGHRDMVASPTQSRRGYSTSATPPPSSGVPALLPLLGDSSYCMCFCNFLYYNTLSVCVFVAATGSDIGAGGSEGQ